MMIQGPLSLKTPVSVQDLECHIKIFACDGQRLDIEDGAKISNEMDGVRFGLGDKKDLEQTGVLFAVTALPGICISESQ